MRLFLDLDGVLADFDTHHGAIFGVRPDRILDNVRWDQVRGVKDFYANIPPMADMAQLWEYAKPHNPTVLTGIPSSVDEAADNKRAWVKKHLGEDVPVSCCASRNKFMYAEPGDILVDDWPRYQALWEKAGGVWVTHTSAEDTIKQLKALGL